MNKRSEVQFPFVSKTDWCNDKELSLRTNAIGWNSLKIFILKMLLSTILFIFSIIGIIFFGVHFSNVPRYPYFIYIYIYIYMVL